MSEMVTTGKKGYSSLAEVDVYTGQKTNYTKPNVPEDPNYIPMVVDYESCPVGEFSEEDFSNEFS